MRRRLVPTVLVLALAETLWMPPDGAAAGRRDVLAERAPAVVRVEAVLQTKVNMDGQGEEQESRVDLMGTLVSPGGLVMIWNSHVSAARMSEMMNEMRGGGFDIDISPTAFEVHLDGGREASAFLAASDTPLDLAFLQLEEEPAEPLPFVDFSRSTPIAVGDEVLAVDRMGRSFDFAPYLQSARIGGEIRKPRQAFILDGSLTTFGLPVYDLGGAPVGALTTIYSRAGDTGSAANLGMAQFMGQFLGGGGGAGPLGAFVLPGQRVAAIVDLARERAVQLLEERRQARAAGETPPPDAAPDPEPEAAPEGN